MNTIFLSDVHLQSDTPLYLAFIAWLQRLPISRLFILGDLFNTWVSDSWGLSTYQEVLQVLKRHHVSWAPGNREVMMQQVPGLACMQTTLMLDGHRFMVLHGDILVKSWAYHVYRWLARCAGARACYHRLPLAWQCAITRQVRTLHRSSFYTDCDGLPGDLCPYRLQKLADEKPYAIIHGHFHQPIWHQLSNDVYHGILGDWHIDNASVITWNGQYCTVRNAWDLPSS
jgi:UDP-2,3-diacylglucosamine pyrophosphatase LpxH